MSAEASRGSIVVEFLGLGLLLAVPLVYLLVTMSQVERASLAVVTLAEESSRAHATAASPWSARVWQQRAEKEIARDYGLDSAAVSVRISCSGSCPGPGSRVTAVASVKVALPLVPVTAARVGTVRSTSVTLAPRYG